jgi:hypothetical protein
VEIKLGTEKPLNLEEAKRCELKPSMEIVGAKSALNANHTASRTKLASHAQRANDVPVNFS